MVRAEGGPLDSGGPRPTFTVLPAFTARRGAPALALGGAMAHLATPVRTPMYLPRSCYVSLLIGMNPVPQTLLEDNSLYPFLLVNR